jgi:DNA-binding XRE family transcriptional regulator
MSAATLRRMTDTLRYPEHPPFHYVEGGWPHGTVRELTEVEGGELIRYQVDQVRRLVIDLTQRREARGLSATRLAKLAGVRPNTVTELEAGRRSPTWATLARLAYVLETDLRLVPRKAVPTRLPTDP